MNEYSTMSLADWQNELWEINDGNLLNISSSDVCLQLVGATGLVAEAVRRNRYYLIISELGNGLGELINLYNRILYDETYNYLFKNSMGLDATIFQKFPRRCFYCGEKHCECHIVFGDTDARTKEDEEKAFTFAQDKLKNARLKEIAPTELDEYERMFAQIYGQGHRYSTIDSINHHLMEEVGETARAHLHLKESVKHGSVWDDQKEEFLSPEKCRDNLLSEMADVISWIAALRRKAEYHILKSASPDESSEAINIPKLSDAVLLYAISKKNGDKQ